MSHPIITKLHCQSIIERRNAVTTTQEKKAYKGWGMEGFLARWYARTTGRSMEQFRKEAQEIAHQLPAGGAVLEVAPGPGYLSIELAKLGSYHIVGLDISRSFVRMATENAIKAGVDVTFQEGNASAMPLASDSFDFVFCRAAFKNFSEPVQAIQEMYRVLKPGGKAVIRDLRKDASPEAINDAVKQMGLGWFNAMLTRWTLQWLRKRAYSREGFRQMAAETSFGTCEINCTPMGADVMLRK
jgi:ubiquinone/menaquinone biosynthesis C-methylase UbiE